MKLKLVVVFLLAFRILSAQVQAWQWAKAGSGTNSDTGNGIATDASGNVFVTGYFFSNTINFGTYTLTNTGNYETFLVKYDGAGNVQWARSAAGAFDDIATAITTDPSGNIYITGNFTSPTLTFGTYTLTNIGGNDIFIVKYDTNGNVLWAKSEGANNSEESNAITSDLSGNIFITGWFQSAAFTIGTTTLTNSGGGDVFIAKYDGAGNPQWAVSQDGSSLDIGYGISADPSGNIFVSGSFKSATMVVGTYTLTNAGPGQADMFVAKYNGSGIAQWANSAGGFFEEIGYAVTADLSGNCIVTGSYKSSTITFGSTTYTNASVGSCEIFVSKYDGLGNVMWARSAGGTSDDIGFGVDVDASGSVYVTGHMHSSSMNLGFYVLFNNGTSVGDVYVIKYDILGNITWAENEGGTSDDGGASIATGSGLNVYLTGFFVGPSINFGSYTLNSSGNSDVFVAKLASTIGENESGSLGPTSFAVYPNPSTGVFKIMGSKDLVLENIEVLNVIGELVYTSGDIGTIDLSDKPKGIYFVKVSFNSKTQTLKIVLD